jgi:hypothetical protein
MRRWAISKIVGTGTEFDPFRPKLVDKLRLVDITAYNCRTYYPPKQNGSFVFDWCLVYAEGTDAAAPDDWSYADGDAEILPAFFRNEDTLTLGDIKGQRIPRILTALDNMGFDTTGLTDEKTITQAIEIIGEQIQPGFNRLGMQND